jgi:hypothetical protein
MRNIKFHAKLNYAADFLFLLLDGNIKTLQSEATLKEKETNLKCYKVTVVSTLAVVELGLRSLGMSAKFNWQNLNYCGLLKVLSDSTK